MTKWKLGPEYAPFHACASHISPDYRDGWNACYAAARQSIAKEIYTWTGQKLLLAAGEMTAAERRTVEAVVRAIAREVEGS